MVQKIEVSDFYRGPYYPYWYPEETIIFIGDKEFLNLEQMNFGQALEALKQGRPIARAGWNGKNMWVYLNKGAFGYENAEATDEDIKEINSSSDATINQIDGISLNLFEAHEGDIATRLPNINMKTATGSIVTGWLASQTDMLAEDWCVL